MLACDIVYFVCLLNGYLRLPHSWKAGISLTHFYILPHPLQHLALCLEILIKGPYHVPLPGLCQYLHLSPPQPTGWKLGEDVFFQGRLMALNLSNFPAGKLSHLSLPPTRTQRVGHFLEKGPSHNTPLYEAATFAPSPVSTFRAILLSD